MSKKKVLFLAVVVLLILFKAFRVFEATRLHGSFQGEKEEIQALIDKQRRTLAEVEYLDLNSAAKVVQEFENPKLLGENLREREGNSTAGRTYSEDLSASRRVGYTKKQHDALLDRTWRQMNAAAEHTIGLLGLDGMVTVMETAEGLTGRKARAKGCMNCYCQIQGKSLLKKCHSLTQRAITTTQTGTFIE